MTFRLLLLPLAAITVLASYAHSQAPSAAERSIVVEQAFVSLIEEVRIPATQIGMLMAIYVKEGDSVQQDALLANIDNRESVAKQRIAEGELQAALKTAENTAEIELAKTGIGVAKAEYDAWLEIQAKTPGAVSKTDINKYHFQHERAVAQEKVAKNDNVIAHVTSQVKQAQLDAAHVDLDLRQIKAPFKGQVIEIFKKRGEWVQPGDAIMHVVGLDKVRVKGTVSAANASAAEVVGKPVLITLNVGGKEHTVKGTIGFASPVIDLSGDFRVFADVDNEKSIDPVTKQESWKIQPGAMARMTIDLTPRTPSRPLATKAEPSKSGPSKTASTSKTGASPPPAARPTAGSPDSKTTPAGKTSPGTKKSTSTTASASEAVQALKPILTATEVARASDSSDKKSETKSVLKSRER